MLPIDFRNMFFIPVKTAYMQNFGGYLATFAESIGEP